MILLISRKLFLSHKCSVEIYNGHNRTPFPGKAILLTNLSVFLPLSLLLDMLRVCVFQPSPTFTYPCKCILT
jgi:hypothetical protein